MKRVFLVLLSICILLGATGLEVFASGGGNTQLGRSVQNTQLNKGVVSTSNLTGNMTVGQNFSVIFDAQSFGWDGTTGEFSQGKLNTPNDWIMMNSAAAGAITRQSFSLDRTTGALTVNYKATAVYDGPLEIWLDSGTTGGAIGPTNRLSTSVKVTDPVQATESKIKRTQGSGTAATNNYSGAIDPGQTISFTFPANNFEWDPANGTMNAAALTDTGWIKLRGANIGTDFNVSYSTPTGSSGSVVVTLTALKSGTYNNLQVYLQGGTSGTATTYSTAVNVTVNSTGTTKIVGIASDAEIGGKWSGALLNGKAISYSQLSHLEINLEDELLIPFDAGFFQWEGTAPYSGSAVTTTQLTRGKVKVATSNKKGSNVFKSGTFELVSKNGRAYLKVEFVDSVTTTKDIDFSVNLYLSVDGKRHNDSGLQLSGTLTRDLIEIDSDSDYVDISDGSIVEPSEYVRNAELYLGNGVSVIANLTSGRKYAGTATHDVSSADEKLLNKYPEIELVLSLKTTNLSSGKVIMDYSENYYVYNANYEYVGRSNDKLPYSSKYYLSNKRIDLKTETVDPGLEPNPVEVPEYPAGSGSATEVPPKTNNDNPYTGRAF